MTDHNHKNDNKNTTKLQTMKKTNFINLTPHEIVIMEKERNNVCLRIPHPTGCNIARVSTKTKKCSPIHNIETCRIEYGEIQHLPEPRKNTYYIVSLLVGEVGAKNGRTDLIGPNTNEAIRDDNGRIMGVPGFVRYGGDVVDPFINGDNNIDVDEMELIISKKKFGNMELDSYNVHDKKVYDSKGRVAVLINPKKALGLRDKPEPFLLEYLRHYPPLVMFLLKGNKILGKLIEKHNENKGSYNYTSYNFTKEGEDFFPESFIKLIYARFLLSLEITWIEKGCRYRIGREGYDDDEECVEIFNDEDWFRND